MEWNDKLQQIVDYVEVHLQKKEEPIDNQEIAEIAGCSFGFFQKVFSYMHGISFADYIRSRKLTLAGYDLKSTHMRVVDISYKYGYNSPTSFTKAFSRFHGISPSEARSSREKLCVMPKLQIQEQTQFSWRIVQREEFRLVGKRTVICRKNQEHFLKIPEFWSKCQKDGTYSRLISMDAGNPKGIFGLFVEPDGDTDEIEYSMMVISNGPVPDGFTGITIPKATWAVFDCVGVLPKSIHKGWIYLWQEWLVKYPFRHAPCPELEWYSDQNQYSEQYLSQIWIPILEEE